MECILNDDSEGARVKFEDLRLSMAEVQNLVFEYDKANEDYPAFTFWWQYMGLVSILLALTQALR